MADFVPGPHPGPLGRGIVNGGDDLDQALVHGHFQAKAGEFTADADAQFAIAFGIQIGAVGVQNVQPLVQGQGYPAIGGHRPGRCPRSRSRIVRRRLLARIGHCGVIFPQPRHGFLQQRRQIQLAQIAAADDGYGTAQHGHFFVIQGNALIGGQSLDQLMGRFGCRGGWREQQQGEGQGRARGYDATDDTEDINADWSGHNLTFPSDFRTSWPARWPAWCQL